MATENISTKMKKDGKKNRRVYIHGNYPSYYGYRKGHKQEEDPRIRVFKKEWFEGKECLDIGCNQGLITISIAKKFHCRSILGIDIDKILVENAQKELQKLARTDTAKCENESTSTEANIISRVSFKHENFVQDLHGCIEKYDTILCLSVAKWIHLNGNDDGLVLLFAKIWRLLRPGGVFVFEPQPWLSYKKNRCVSEKATENFRSILIYPHLFEEILLDKIGFRYVETITDSLSGTVAGFNRPIMAFIK